MVADTTDSISEHLSQLILDVRTTIEESKAARDAAQESVRVSHSIRAELRFWLPTKRLSFR